MARSDLFKKLRRAIQSLDRPIDRRTFLRGSVAASVLTAAALYPSASRLIPNPRRFFASLGPKRESGPIAIIGAGLAGLAAAYELRKHGYASTVYEASMRTGGRVFTRENFHKGMFCEMGGELIDRNHQSLLGLAQELGVVVEEIAPGANDSAETLFFMDGRIYTEAQLCAAVGPLVKRVRADRVYIFGNVEGEILDSRSAPKYPNAARFDQMTLAEYLEKLEGVETWVKRLVGHAYINEFGLPLDEQSALNLHLLVDYDLSDGEFSLFGESDESLRVKGGNSQIVNRLTERVVAENGEIQYGHRLVAMEERGTKVRLFFEGPGGKTQMFEAVRVICAIPFSLLRTVEIRSPLAPRTKAAIRRLSYGTHAKSMIGTRDRFWRNKKRGVPGSNGSWLNDLKSQAYWETSQGQAAAGGILTSFRGGVAGRAELAWDSPDHSADTVVGGFLSPYRAETRAKHAPGMLEAKASAVWANEPFALGSYSCPRPGDYTEILGVAEEPEWNGKLLFAGEHASANFGYMDAAVESAIKAVEFLTEDRARVPMRTK